MTISRTCILALTGELARIRVAGFSGRLASLPEKVVGDEIVLDLNR
jgi:hypothetical protein